MTFFKGVINVFQDIAKNMFPIQKKSNKKCAIGASPVVCDGPTHLGAPKTMRHSVCLVYTVFWFV